MKPNQAIQKLKTIWQSPSYVMMMGVPGVGKSTFLKKFLEDFNELYFIASTDNLIEAEATKLGLTYSEVFHKVNQKTIKREMETGITNAVHARKTIFHDQTNMGRKSRVSKLELIPAHYNKICLNFTVNDKILYERLANRAVTTGKNIPEFVIKQMFNSYNAPSKSEGFNLILEIDNS